MSISDVVRAEVGELPPENDESQAIHKLEVARLERDKLQIQNDVLNEKIKDQQADRQLRERYANYAFRFLFGFSIFSGSVLIAQGTPSCPFKLEGEMVVTLIGATAASVIALVGWIAKGLFRAPSNDS